MGTWDILLIIAIAIIFALAVFLTVRRKKKGGCCCGCSGGGNCPSCNSSNRGRFSVPK